MLLDNYVNIGLNVSATFSDRYTRGKVEPVIFFI